MKKEEILSCIDHTLLKAFAKWEDIDTLCEEAVKAKTASVCVPQSYIKRISEKCPDLNICTVVGFPLGYNSTGSKVQEIKDALENGANEIDMVVNISDVKNGDYDTVPASLLWQIPVLSFLGALSSLIYPWDRSMTRKEFVIRIAIHYLIMNGIVLGGGSLFGWFDIHEPLQVAMMALSVAIIFFIISLYSWTKGNREAQKLNQRLKKRNDNE